MSPDALRCAAVRCDDSRRFGLMSAPLALAASGKPAPPPLPDYYDDGDPYADDAGSGAGAAEVVPAQQSLVSCEILSVTTTTASAVNVLPAPAATPAPGGSTDAAAAAAAFAKAAALAGFGVGIGGVGNTKGGAGGGGAGAASPFSALLLQTAIAHSAALDTAPLSEAEFDAQRKAGLDVLGMPLKALNASAAPTAAASSASATNAAAATAASPATTATAADAKSAAPKAATATAAAAPVAMHHFAWRFAEETAVYCQVLVLGGKTLWVWVGGQEAAFGNLNLALGIALPSAAPASSAAAAPSASPSPAVTSFFGKNVELSGPLTARLAAVTGRVVYASYNLPSHQPMLEQFVQKKVVDALKALGLHRH